jgi:RNA polymerase sigma-54 factor
MRPALQIQSGQQLSMTPLLQRAIQFLQLSSLEFTQEVREALANNPFLEAAEASEEDLDAEAPAEPEPAPTEPEPDAVLGDGLSTGPWESRLGGFDSDDEFDPALQVPATRTLRTHLMEQAGCLPLSDRDRVLVQTIIDALDTSGYLSQPLAELIDMFPPDQAPQPEELNVALRFVQAMEPAGVGARSVAECLRLQLQAMPEDRPGRTLALAIVEHHLDLFASRDFQRLQRELQCDDTALGEATVLIRKLTPRPGAAFSVEQAQFVVADVIVHKVKSKWVATINPQVVPKIQLNHVYANILQNARDTAGGQIGQQLQEARWLLRNIEQRFGTIQKVAQAIVDRQTRFFDYGDVAMRPLTLRDIAEAVGLHESTVSRVTSRKYMATPRGLLEFKHFFGSHVETAEGSPCSATAVRALIKQLIAAEEPSKPLSDIKLTRLLEQRGIKVARRTVAKYRDLLQIPPVEIRRLSYRPQQRAIAGGASSA